VPTPLQERLLAELFAEKVQKGRISSSGHRDTRQTDKCIPDRNNGVSTPEFSPPPKPRLEQEESWQKMTQRKLRLLAASEDKARIVTQAAFDPQVKNHLQSHDSPKSKTLKLFPRKVSTERQEQGRKIHLQVSSWLSGTAINVPRKKTHPLSNIPGPASIFPRTQMHLTID